MPDPSPLPEPPDWLNDLAPMGLPDMAPRDYIYCLELHFDVDSQLEAINELLTRHRTAAEEARREIERSDEHARKLEGIRNDFPVDYHISLLHASVYQDAASSMAAVGMLAPFIETVFHQCFEGIGRRFFPSAAPTSNHERWIGGHAMQWDCHSVISKGRAQKDLVRGIKQLAEAIDIWRRFPPDLEKTLNALFGYRNKTFHCGFEWPPADRAAFGRRADNGEWPATWFSRATCGGEPWVFYMTDQFIEHCLSIAEQVVTVFGEFVRDALLPNRPRTVK